MASDKKMLAMAAEIALSKDCKDNRAFFLGSVGIRADGCMVTARNVASMHKVPSHHAEARLARKLTPKSAVWIARVTRNNEWAVARPCCTCEARLRSAGIKRVVYTIGPNEWGIMNL